MSNLRASLRDLAFRVPLIGPRYRRLWQAAESHYQVNPGHYASPIPSPEDIDRESSASPRMVGDGLPGIQLRTSDQLAFLGKLGKWIDPFPFPAEMTEERRYHFQNDWFQFTDAAVLHALIREQRPSRLVEIGSGYSSCVVLDTLDLDVSLETNVTLVEPDCQRLRSRLRLGDESRVRLLNHSIQDVPRDSLLELGAGDILLIDSSHVSKPGSDVNLIVHEILPSLAPGVFVHFHDIFFPFTYPRRLLDNHQYWNEAYLLRAFLCQNDQFEIVLWNDYLNQTHRDAVVDAMAADHDDIACSIWIRRR